MTLQSIRAQLVGDSLVLKTHTYRLAMQFAVVLHQWVEQQQASPTVPVPTHRMDYLYQELKSISEIGLLSIDIIKMIDQAKASEEAVDPEAEPLTDPFT